MRQGAAFPHRRIEKRQLTKAQKLEAKQAFAALQRESEMAAPMPPPEIAKSPDSRQLMPQLSAGAAGRLAGLFRPSRELDASELADGARFVTRGIQGFWRVVEVNFQQGDDSGILAVRVGSADMEPVFFTNDRRVKLL
jgi:hypothetical protein